MSEIVKSAGAEAAWEKWRERVPTFTDDDPLMTRVTLAASELWAEKGFVAGFEAALAGIEAEAAKFEQVALDKRADPSTRRMFGDQHVAIRIALRNVRESSGGEPT